MLYIFYPVIPYQALEKTTADCYFRGIKMAFNLVGIEELADLFIEAILAPTADRDAGLQRALRALPVDFARWLRFLVACGVHRKNAARERSFKHLVDQLVDKLVSVAVCDKNLFT